MTSQRLFEGLNYQQAQKRNSEKFNSFNHKKQKDILQQGYKNFGWENIIKSWQILEIHSNKHTINTIDYAIEKAEKNFKKVKQNSTDVVEIIEAGKSVIQAIKLKYK